MNVVLNRKKLSSLAVLIVLLVAVQVTAQTGKDQIGPQLQTALDSGEKTADATDDVYAVWVYFTDKDLSGSSLSEALDLVKQNLGDEVMSRRARGTIGPAGLDLSDAPLAPRYLAAAVATGAEPRRVSRWLNAASYNAREDQIMALSQLPFVRQVELVARGSGRKPALETEMPADLRAQMTTLVSEKTLDELDYGASLPGLAQINVPAAHARGLTGKGVTVAVLDTGFELNHDALAGMDVGATWDFINDDEYVGFRKNDDPNQTFYGTASASILAGFSRSNLIGSAYEATMLLAKTEDLKSETPAEEDNWIAAVEWAESLGADVIASGLGYYNWYDFSQMDGRTAAITVAAEMATARGVCVVNGVGDMRANQEWPHLLPPADGRGVIAVGAVDVNNQVAWFSSPGPTADGRIKPDVMALGSGHPAAAARIHDLYNFSYGTNYATPLVAGVVALVLQANPHLSPLQVLEALRETASRSVLPDNDFGWGMVNAVAAVDYWVPTIAHTPLHDSEGGAGSYPVTATISDARGLDSDRLYLVYRVEEGNWQIAPMASEGGDVYKGLIPPQGRQGKVIDYYLSATNTVGLTSSDPTNAPAVFNRFREGVDTTPPVISHLGLVDIIPTQWPPTLSVTATDNQGLQDVSVFYTVPGLGSQGPVSLKNVGGDRYELTLPTPPSSIFPGFTITYFFLAKDTAAVPNTTLTEVSSFKIVATKGHVLLVDDRNNSKQGAASERESLHGVTQVEKSAADVAQWLRVAGFTVDILAASDVKSSSFLGYDAVMMSSGSNFAPYVYSELRRTLVAWTEQGGKLLIEGGETGYAAAEIPGYPELLGQVLHIDGYGGEDGARMRAPAELVNFPIVSQPHRLSMPLLINNNNDWGAADLVNCSRDAFVAMHVGYGLSRGGVIVYDDNTGPASGQIVYFPFDVSKAGSAAGQALLDNTMTYLLTTEPAGPASISGRVTLAGQEGMAGVTVSAGQTHQTVTEADGTYVLSGLWGGDYQVTAEAAGHAPSVHQITAVDGLEIADSNFYLIPVTEVNFSRAPGIAIPDNNPQGIEDVISVSNGGQVYGITVDVDIPHFAIGQLTATLTNPNGISVTLHNRTGGVIDDLEGTWPTTLFVDGPGELSDFIGQSVTGDWTLHVSDHQFGALGTLRSWGLNMLVKSDSASAVDERLPAATRLLGNSPNPFNPRTSIAFELEAPREVRVDIYDIRGRVVRHLLDHRLEAGRHEVVWDGRNEAGGETASGLYFYRFIAGGKQDTKKMLLVR
ncbi:MAG: subtilisin-like proprotein convertase family protein [Candidatus Krumholzibacteriia bacterium]